MPRRCSICTHPEKAAIDTALVAAEPFRHIAARYGTSTGALQRHKKDHLPASLVLAQGAQEVAQADDLLGQVQALQVKALSILAQAEKAGELRTALAAVREARACVELLAKLLVEIGRQRLLSRHTEGETSELTDEEAGRRFLALLTNEELDTLAEIARRVQLIDQP